MSGGSAAQSSTIQCYDAALGIQHPEGIATGLEYFKDIPADNIILQLATILHLVCYVLLFTCNAIEIT